MESRYFDLAFIPAVSARQTRMDSREAYSDGGTDAGAPEDALATL